MCYCSFYVKKHTLHKKWMAQSDPPKEPSTYELMACRPQILSSSKYDKLLKRKGSCKWWFEKNELSLLKLKA